jgi:hypothetical protein
LAFVIKALGKALVQSSLAKALGKARSLFGWPIKQKGFKHLGHYQSTKCSKTLPNIKALGKSGS